jgi:hypothetical protein
VDPATVEKTIEDEDKKPKDVEEIPPIHQIINIDDFQVPMRDLFSSDSRKLHNVK